MRHYVITGLLVLAFTFVGQTKAQDDIAVNAGIFYSPLSHYGEWINCEFGVGWRPLHVRHDWRPYILGRWVWSDYGWYWVSDEPFGWATFHYGRWLYDDYNGWIWIPGNDWGPAWVEWCYNDDYIGWAPLSPHVSFHINIGVTFGHHWRTPNHYWNFIPGRYFAKEHMIDHVQPIRNNDRIRRNAHNGEFIRYEDHRITNRGIAVTDIERRTNTRIRKTEIITTDRQDGDRFINDKGRERIESYKPRINPNVRNEGNAPRTRTTYDRSTLQTQRDANRDQTLQREQRSVQPRSQRTFEREQQLRTMRERQTTIEQRTQRAPRESQRAQPEQRQPTMRERPEAKQRSQQSPERNNRESRTESKGRRR